MLLPQVFVQGGPQAEGYVAVGALEARATRPQAMHTAVAVKLTALGAGVGAELAGVGPLPCVRAPVHCQVAAVGEMLPTELTAAPRPAALAHWLWRLLGRHLWALGRVSSLFFLDGDSPAVPTRARLGPTTRSPRFLHTCCGSSSDPFPTTAAWDGASWGRSMGGGLWRGSWLWRGG